MLINFSEKEKIDDSIMRLIVDQLNCVAITDHKGRYVYVNESWSDIMGGIKIKDIKGKYVHDLIPDTKIDEALKLKKTITGHAIKTKGPNIRDAFSSYIPIFKDGRIIACFVHVIIIGINSALEFTKKVNYMANQIDYYKQELKKIRRAKYSIDNIIGTSEPIKKMKHNIYKAARSSSTVLIEGETGSGKELVAHAIHDLSPRTEEPLIKVNCAAIPNELLESEFFGYTEGAFTGAKRGGKIGKFEMANKGSLFLDEINQLAYTLQPKLLRVLQEKEIEQIGGKNSIPVNFRLIAATSCSLEKMIKKNRFRPDLYYRLNVITIEIPPLRDRKEDIPLIADSLLDKLNFQLGINSSEITDKAKAKLQEYHWPGNVRELQNVIERAINIAWGDKLKWEYFEPYFNDKHLRARAVKKNHSNYNIKEIKNNIEKEAIKDALKQSKNNKTKAAELLGISRTLIYKKIKKYELA